MYISIYTITSANFSDHAILYVYIYIYTRYTFANYHDDYCKIK